MEEWGKHQPRVCSETAEEPAGTQSHFCDLMFGFYILLRNKSLGTMTMLKESEGQHKRQRVSL